MARSVIVGYMPKPEMEDALHRLVAKHWNVLRGEGLVTERSPFIMRAAGGAIVEVFEWRSAEAIEAAHGNPAVLRLWEEFEACCTYVPVGKLSEASTIFSEFESIET